MADWSPDQRLFDVTAAATKAFPAKTAGVHMGSLARIWLPYPQEYRQQKDVKLISASFNGQSYDPQIAPNGAPQRTAYFQQRISDPAKPEPTMATSQCPSILDRIIKNYRVNLTAWSRVRRSATRSTGRAHGAAVEKACRRGRAWLTQRSRLRQSESELQPIGEKRGAQKPPGPA